MSHVPQKNLRVPPITTESAWLHVLEPKQKLNIRNQQNILGLLLSLPKLFYFPFFKLLILSLRKNKRVRIWV